MHMARNEKGKGEKKPLTMHDETQPSPSPGREGDKGRKVGHTEAGSQIDRLGQALGTQCQTRKSKVPRSSTRLEVTPRARGRNCGLECGGSLGERR